MNEWLDSKHPIWALLIAITGSGGILMTAFRLLQSYLDRKVERKRSQSVPSRWQQALPNLHNLYSLTRDAMLQTDSHRVLVIRAENGGAQPEVGKPCYLTVVAEEHDDELPSIKDSYQRVLVDHEFIGILKTAVSDGVVSMDRGDLSAPAVGLLSKMYQAQGVTHTEFRRVGIVADKGEEALILIACEYTCAQEVSAQDIWRIDDYARRLRVLIEKTKEVVLPAGCSVDYE